MSEASLRVTEQLTVTPVSPEAATLASTPPGEWALPGLELFIREEITRLHGAQLPVTSAGKIIESFWERHGVNAVRIALHIFGVRQGMWRGAPVTIRRFEAGQDDFFALPILQELNG